MDLRAVIDFAPIYRQAIEAFPRECCGLIIGPPTQHDRGADAAPGERWQVIPCENVQDKLHERFPEQYERDSRTAFYIDDRILYTTLKEAEANGRALKAIYHSHCNADAYFSETDIRAATAMGEPTYPGVYHIVVSVWNGKVKEVNAYHWDDTLRTFAKIEVESFV